MPSGVRDGRLGRACRELDGRGGGVEQRLEQLAVALDADELEVQGLIRSVSLRTNLDREPRIAETFSCAAGAGSSPKLSRTSEGLDRRLIAREVDSPAGGTS